MFTLLLHLCACPDPCLQELFDIDLKNIRALVGGGLGLAKFGYTLAVMGVCFSLGTSLSSMPGYQPGSTILEGGCSLVSRP
jgi:hypothetical protein